VRQAHPAVTLAIRGDGPLRTALQRRIARLGLVDNVTWLPRVPDVAALAAIYRSGRMLVCASTSEGGPRVTVEAMACGVPVISTPVGIMSELVDPGVNGLLFEWDAAELAGHIRDLLADDDRRRRMGAAGHAAVQHFQADRVIAAYARGYHDLVHRLKES
jgi:glycosyltransferase involved in cell wall biosynthesis